MSSQKPKDRAEPIIRYVASCARAFPEVEKVILFGSRVRGDSRERSDYDFAIIAPEISHPRWSKFSVQVEENRPTLCGFDLLLVSSDTPEHLRKKIYEEGVVIYDKAA